MRRGLLAVLASFLVVLLLGAALDYGVLHVAGNAQSVEKLLADSGVYNGVISSALDQAQTSAGNVNQVALNDPAVKSAAETTFTPKVVQQYTEQAINGIYDWLNGKSAQPDFHIDLTQIKQDFAQKVGQAAGQRAAKLPACTAVPATTDPLSITCLPHGVTPAQIQAQAISAVMSSQGFLEHPQVTADSVKKSGANQSVFVSGKLQSAPKQFQRAKKAPVILTILALLDMVAIIFLSTSRGKGLGRVGFVLVFAGVLLLLAAWGLNTVNSKVIAKIQFDNKVLQTDTQKLATDLIHSTKQSYQTYGVAYAVAGALAIGGALLVGRKFKQDTSTATKSPQNDSVPAKPAYKPPQPPKRTPPKIQG